jgi:hypothetical protein
LYARDVAKITESWTHSIVGLDSLKASVQEMALTVESTFFQKCLGILFCISLHFVFRPMLKDDLEDLLLLFSKDILLVSTTEKTEC